MLRYMLDTNLCVRVLRNRPLGLRERFKSEADRLCISTISLTELLHGVARSARPEHNRGELERLIAGLEVLAYGPDAAAHAAEIRADLEQRGCIIGAYDILIAGHARSLGLVVITGNLGEFRRVSGLQCEDWLAPN